MPVTPDSLSHIRIFRTSRASLTGLKNASANASFESASPCTVIYATPIWSGLLILRPSNAVPSNPARSSNPAVVARPNIRPASRNSGTPPTLSWSIIPAADNPDKRAAYTAFEGEYGENENVVWMWLLTFPSGAGKASPPASESPRTPRKASNRPAREPEFNLPIKSSIKYIIHGAPVWYNWPMKKVGFIGAGKAGCSLGRHISENGGGAYAVAGYSSRNIGSAHEAAAIAGGRAYETAEALAADCDILLVTVTDGQIVEVWKQLHSALLCGREGRVNRDGPLLVGHCSGNLSSDVFGEDAEPSPVFSCGSVHPLVAIHDRETAYKKLEGAYFTVEGDKAFTDFASGLLTTLGNPFSIIAAEQKTLYHAACVMVSNLVCGLAYEGMEAFRACGLEGAFAESAWRALFLGNAESVAGLGPVLALTGPVERGDTATVARHIEALSGDTREIYLRLSRTLVKAAQEKNPDRDYSALKQLLENTGGLYVNKR